MKFPNPEEHWNEWGKKLAYSESIGNIEGYWLDFLDINKRWWKIFMKGMSTCPCDECPFLDECPDMYACQKWVEWANKEE